MSKELEALERERSHTHPSHGLLPVYRVRKV